MSIEDPQDALRAQLEAEKRSESPVIEMARRLLELLPTGPLGALAEFAKLRLDKAEKERIEATLETFGEEIRYLKRRLASRPDEFRQWAEKELPPLVLDACQKARTTSFVVRVRRIARILAHALDLGPSRLSDVTEDLMKVAMNLTDLEVEVLGELVNKQRPFFDSTAGRAAYDDVNRYWAGVDHQGYQHQTRMPAVTLGISEGDLQTACAKLQSFGLVVQIDRSPTFGLLGLPPFSILGRGIEFVESIKSFQAEG